MEGSPLRILELRELSEEEKARLLERSQVTFEEVMPKVRNIVSEVRERGDEALLEYTRKYDKVDLDVGDIEVSKEEISQAYDQMEDENVDAIDRAAGAVERYHRKQLPDDWLEEFEPGISAGQVVRPLDSVGCYAPGGVAQYPSSVLMEVIPARVSGVKRIVLCTPPNFEGQINPSVLVAADLSEADEIYKVGGAQAIAAMAYGTETILPTDKVVGPGNIYVSAAKKIVSMDVDIDFVAGPSEVLILADSSADPRSIALDLAAQSEHRASSASVLVTTSKDLAESVREEFVNVLENAPRKEIIVEAIEKYGGVIVCEALSEAVEFSNEYGPEHLQVMTEDPENLLDKIVNAGAIFLGQYSTVSAGDFAVGPSHILPTGRGARRHSGISVFEFIRMPSVQKLSKEGLKNLAATIERFARLEGFPGHARSVRERLGE